jgi:hypothetical protein
MCCWLKNCRWPKTNTTDAAPPTRTAGSRPNHAAHAPQHCPADAVRRPRRRDHRVCVRALRLVAAADPGAGLPVLPGRHGHQHPPQHPDRLGLRLRLVGRRHALAVHHDEPLRNIPGPMAVAAVILLGLYMGLFSALATGGATWLRKRWSLPVISFLLLVLPFAWGLSEWMRGWVLTGFPWVASGYAHNTSPLAGFAPLVGVYGLGVIAARVRQLLHHADPARALGGVGLLAGLMAPASASNRSHGLRPRARRSACACCKAMCRSSSNSIPGTSCAHCSSTSRCDGRTGRPDRAAGNGGRVPAPVPAARLPGRFPDFRGPKQQPPAVRHARCPTGLANTPTAWSASPLPAPATATTSTTWCPSANSCRWAFAGSST